MKYILKVICILSVSVLFCGCEKLAMDRRETVMFENNAKYGIYVYSMLMPLYYDNSENNVFYPDTSLPNVVPNQIEYINKMSSKDIVSTSSGILHIFSRFGVDTISIFVFSADTIEDAMYWSDIRDSYNILQRYDVSPKDLGYLSFPPTEEMRNIKMWPPYGTYNDDGFRIE